MKTTSLSLSEAKAFLKNHQRHYRSEAQPICAIGLSDDGALHGAAILGRTKEGHGQIAHIYCDGVWQGYSLLYGACWRAYAALGYETVKL